MTVEGVTVAGEPGELPPLGWSWKKRREEYNLGRKDNTFLADTNIFSSQIGQIITSHTMERQLNSYPKFLAKFTQLLKLRPLLNW